MLSDGYALTFHYASSNKNIVTVDKNGRVTSRKKAFAMFRYMQRK